MKNLFYVLLVLSTSLITSAQEASKIALNYFAAIDAGETENMGKLISENFSIEVPFSPKPFTKQEWMGVVPGLKAAFPDLKHEIISYFSDGKNVAIRGNFTGTNSGSFMGMPPTKNKVKTPFTTLFMLNDKKIIQSAVSTYDQKVFEAQLMAGIPSTQAMNEKTIRELFDVMDAGQIEKFPMYCSADFMISNPFLPTPAPIQAFQEILKNQKMGFPDLDHEIVHITSNENTVITKGIFKGTNTGSLMGNPATGNKVNLPFLVWDEFDGNGKLKNRLVQFDSKSFEMQLMAGLSSKK